MSPPVNLASLQPPVVVRWAQRYQMENTSFDQYTMDLQPVGVPGSAVRLFEWLDATMTDPVGNPVVTLNESAGWSQVEARADALAGQNVELRFNLTSDTTVQLAGAAVDDVSPAVSLAKTVYRGHDAGAGCAGSNLLSGLNGEAVTYCFVVTNRR